MSEHAHGEHAHHSSKPYWMVFGALMVLTVITVALAKVDLGAANKAVGLAVATVKATLVVLIFMHMREDGAKDKYLVVSVIFPICLFLLLTMACLPDVVFRGGDSANAVGGSRSAPEGPPPK